MKRWICLFLSLLLTLTALPGVEAAPAERSDSWTALETIEDRAAARSAARSAEALAAVYADRTEEMVLAVRAAADYVPGSLERHGDFFFWETRDGRANGYSPSLRAELRAERQQTAAESAGIPAPLPVSDPANIPGNRDDNC